jgi:hypothetical protein
MVSVKVKGKSLEYELSRINTKIPVMARYSALTDESVDLSEDNFIDDQLKEQQNFEALL